MVAADQERAVAMDAGAGRRVLDRIGVPAVPLAYLTVGLQSAIIIAAGLVRMRWRTFSLAQIPGAAAWATIYSTIGFAAWAAAIRAIAGDWWPLAIGVLLIALAALIITLCRRARRRPAEAGDETYSLGADPLAGARR